MNTLDISYEAHVQDHPMLLLTLLHRQWTITNRPDCRPRVDYENWLKKSGTKSRFDCLEAVLFCLTMIAGFITIFMETGITWLFATITVVVGLAWLIVIRRARQISGTVKSPVIWEQYQKDLQSLFQAFPILVEGATCIADAKMRVGTDLRDRGEQIASKQEIGFTVDAKKERNALLPDHAIAAKFGLAGELKEYLH